MLLLVVLWLVWCAVHSLLITSSVKRWFERQGGLWVGLYRIGYVCIALVTLLPLLWYTASLPQQSFRMPLWLRGVQWMLLLYAIVLFIGGLRVYDLRAFLGIRQWREYRTGKTNVSLSFKTDGILRYVRHPWYSGGIALLWALPNLSDVTLITRLILSGYLIVGTLLEERKLREILGEDYRTYCQEVPMLIPWKFWHRLPPRTSR